MVALYDRGACCCGAPPPEARSASRAAYCLGGDFCGLNPGMVFWDEKKYTTQHTLASNTLAGAGRLGGGATTVVLVVAVLRADARCEGGPRGFARSWL